MWILLVRHGLSFYLSHARELLEVGRGVLHSMRCAPRDPVALYLADVRVSPVLMVGNNSQLNEVGS
jgi:hypothetical protein